MTDTNTMRVHYYNAFYYDKAGASIDLMDPKVKDVCIKSMTSALAQKIRYAGRKGAPSVLLHESHVADLAEDAGESDKVIDWALKHDHHEAFTGDIIAPMKQLINHTAGKDVFVEIEEKLDRVICEAFGIEYPDSDTRARVHHYDMMARRIEMEKLGMTPDPDLPRVGEPYQPEVVAVAV